MPSITALLVTILNRRPRRTSLLTASLPQHASALAWVLTVAVLFAVFLLPARTGASGSGEKLLTVIRGSESIAAFSIVLLLDTPEARRQGLQGFRELQNHEAALFTFDEPEIVRFWMGAVSYPIDIVFIDGQGIVRHIARDCRPGSPDLYPSHYPVKWVIETAAGSVIKPGDQVLWK